MAALCVNRDKRNLENGGRWAVLTALVKALGLAWSESSAFAVLMCIARVASGVMPLGVLWAGKTIIDRIQETRAVDVATSQSSSIELLAAPIVAYVALTVGREVAKACATLSSEVMASRILGRANIMLMEKLIQHPGLEPFEDYRARDALRNARAGIATRPVEVVDSCLGTLETISACIGAAAVLWHLHPVAMLLVAAVALPSVMVEAELFKRLVKVFADHAAGSRMLAYLDRLQTTREGAQEIRLYGLVQILRSRYRQLSELMVKQGTAPMRTYAWKSSAVAVGETAVVGAAYCYLAYSTASGVLSLGDLSLYSGAVLLIHSQLSSALRGVSRMYSHGMYLLHFFQFLEEPSGLRTRSAPKGHGRKFDGPLKIEMIDVGFRYPGTERSVVTNLNLQLNPGETVGLVGENGSGKSTIVKLLLRFYDPDEGRILVNGDDLREMEPKDYRRLVSVVFQDFCNYEMTMRENIGFGDLQQMSNDNALWAAARKGEAREILDELPNGLESTIGRRFGDRELSMGQWQRVALSRAFLRDSRLLILDEPTATLDAASEHQVYQRCEDLAENRTTLLISHRLNTLRMADRIAVLQSGRIVEEGSHDQLMRSQGRYASLFELQANRYR